MLFQVVLASASSPPPADAAAVQYAVRLMGFGAEGVCVHLPILSLKMVVPVLMRVTNDITEFLSAWKHSSGLSWLVSHDGCCIWA